MAGSGTGEGPSHLREILRIRRGDFKKAERGFSFKDNTKLDMRLGINEKSAYDVINSYSEKELERVFKEYGEIHNAAKIANIIVKERNKKNIETSRELENIIFHNTDKSKRYGKIHPATLVFQAVRIEVNDELNILKDSISNIVTFQFENVLKYDELISLNSNTDIESLINSLQENEDVVDQVTARMETTRIYNNDKDYEVTLTIANNIDELENVISLNDVDNEYQKIELKDDEVVLSEKLATLLEVEKGDNVTFRNEDGKEYALKVTAIAENYINNYVYMTKDTYENVFSPYETNVIFLKIADLTAEEEDELRKEILNNASVSSIVSSENTVSTVSDMMGSLDAVVVILVVASAILAFVVMYNLSNINISERQREIATLKVLGFYDNEVDNYITKENMILAFFGIILGLIVGVYLSHFIITTCETDTLMFVRQVNPLSFVYSATITIAFTLIVNLINHINLKKINMIDSLKSVE